MILFIIGLVLGSLLTLDLICRYRKALGYKYGLFDKLSIQSKGKIK